MVENLKLINSFSYPAKIILTGEHFIIYGSSLLSMCIKEKQITCSLYSSKSDKFIDIKSNYLDCSLEYGINKNIKLILNKIKFEKLFFETPDIYSLVKEIIIKIVEDQTYLQLFRDSINSYYDNINSSDSSILLDRNNTHIILLIDFIFQLFSYLNNDFEFNWNEGFYIELNSNINQGYGLGSSASFSACIVSSILTIIENNGCEKIKNICLDFKKVNDQLNQLVLLLSFISETYFHFKTTGGDLVSILCKGVLTFKSLIEFNVEEGICNEIKKQYNLYLIDSKKSRQAFSLIKRASNLIEKNDLSKISNTIDLISQILLGKIEYDEKSQKLDLLIKENQYYLKSLGVSTDDIDNIINILTDCGFPCKITGAGGGGYILCFVIISNEKSFLETCKLNSFLFEKIIL